MDNYSNPEALAYDLRQRYAKIVGDHLEDVADARRNRNYPEYFKALENLNTIVKHKFKKDKEKKNKEKVVDYNSLRDALIKIANEYQNAWTGEGTDSKEIAKIEKALRDIEEFIYSKMDEAKMFGGVRDQEGL